MRPELAAFRELDTLVRNLSDQLAGYRRRALAAEARARELEQSADALGLKASAAQDRIEALTEELATGADSLRAERSALAKAEASIQELTQALAAAADEARAAGGHPVSPSEKAMMRDNVELRRRLELAGERTKELGERLRFVRQQLATVPDK